MCLFDSQGWLELFLFLNSPSYSASAVVIKWGFIFSSDLPFISLFLKEIVALKFVCSKHLNNHSAEGFKTFRETFFL